MPTELCPNAYEWLAKLEERKRNNTDTEPAHYVDNAKAPEFGPISNDNIKSADLTRIPLEMFRRHWANLIGPNLDDGRAARAHIGSGN